MTFETIHQMAVIFGTLGIVFSFITCSYRIAWSLKQIAHNTSEISIALENLIADQGKHLCGQCEDDE